MEQRVILTDPRKLDYFYEEAIKTLRTNIQFSGRDIKTIMFTSCFPNEGKSDTLIQLAKEIGKAGKRVLLVDADIRKSTFVRRYRVRLTVKGLSQYLSGQVEQPAIYYSTNFENMDMIFAGPMAPNPSELLEEKAFDELLATARQIYDYILIDTPYRYSADPESYRRCDRGEKMRWSGTGHRERQSEIQRRPESPGTAEKKRLQYFRGGTEQSTG